MTAQPTISHPGDKTWADMADAEKIEALYLALVNSPATTRNKDRIRCALESLGVIEIAPKRDTVKLHWAAGCSGVPTQMDGHTHRITFDTLDGKPICGTYADENGNIMKIEALR